MALRFAEELLLLLLNEETGDLAAVPEPRLNHALAGAVLMDLALENRIDTDPEKLVLLDSTPLRDDLLDPSLARIAQDGGAHDAEYWVRRISGEGERVRAAALSRLLQAGILDSAEEGSMSLSHGVSRARRYPAVDGKAQQEVRLRIMGVLFRDDIPEPRDIVLICLADACGMFEKILTRAELEQVRDRIALVRRMDLIGQAVASAVRDSGQEAAPPQKPVRFREIPVVKGLPILGSAREAATDFAAFLTSRYLELGPVFQIRLLHRKLLVLAGPEANRWANREGRYHLRSYEAFRGFAEGFDAVWAMLNMDGREHVRYRQAFAPALSRARFQDHLGIAADITRRHVAAWPVDRPLQPLHAVQRIIADQMGVILAGVPAADYLEDMVFFLETLLTTAVAKQLPLFPFARRFRKARARLEELARKTLEAHEPGGPYHQSGDMIDDLIELHRSDPQLMPETDMTAMTLAPYLLGIETAANTCAFTLYAILKHPDLMERMTAEADALFAEGPLTVEGLGRLDVTHRVVLESLRRYAVAPVLFRTVANSFEFDGCRIPAGAPVLVATGVTHHLPEFFPEPERFDIDRYLPERAEHRQTDAYAPFGVGTHRCLGAGFAEAEILLTLAAMLHGAELALDPPGYELKMTNVPTPRPSKKFKFRVVQRRG